MKFKVGDIVIANHLKYNKHVLKGKGRFKVTKLTGITVDVYPLDNFNIEKTNLYYIFVDSLCLNNKFNRLLLGVL